MTRCRLRARVTGPQAAFVNAEAQFPAMVAGFGAGKTQAGITRALRLKFAYPLDSCTLIGRLAVAKDQQGQRFGSILLANTLQRTLESASTVGSSMVVDALDEAAAGFYAAHGFVRLPDSLRLVRPMRQVERESE